MNCTQSNEYMMKYFDGELNDIESALMNQHFKACSKCQAEFESMEKALKMISEEEGVEPPEDFEKNVMARVEVLEEIKRQKASRWLILLYNVSTSVSIILLLLFVANIKEINIISSLSGIGDYFTSFLGIVSGLYVLVKNIYALVLGTVGIIAQTFITLVKNYYYVFIAMLVLLIGVQKLFFVLVDHDGRDAG